jgi:hypothetical protein
MPNTRRQLHSAVLSAVDKLHVIHSMLLLN